MKNGAERYNMGYKDGEQAENKAWREYKRCENCGKEKDTGTLTRLCLKCLEEALNITL